MPNTSLYVSDKRYLKHINGINTQLSRIAALIAWDAKQQNGTDESLNELQTLAHTVTEQGQLLAHAIFEHYKLSRKTGSE